MNSKILAVHFSTVALLVLGSLIWYLIIRGVMGYCRCIKRKKEALDK